MNAPAIAKPVEPKPVEHTRLVALSFIAPIQFGGVSTSLRIGHNVDSVTPARLWTDGRPRPIAEDEGADGLLLRRTVRGPKGNMMVTQSFVPLTNVAEMLFGE